MQPALFLVKMIADLETNKKKTRYKTPTTNRNNNKVSNIHTSFQKFLDILS